MLDQPTVDTEVGPAEGPIFRYRVAALIVRGESLLLATNDAVDFYYSVGGAVRVCERAEEALRRELLEETGWSLEVGRLVVVHEDFFVSRPHNVTRHEISLYFLVDVPDDFVPRGGSVSLNGAPEHLSWVSIDALGEVETHPTWLRREFKRLGKGVQHIVTCDDGLYFVRS